MTLQWTKPTAYAAALGIVAVVGSPIRENFKPLAKREDDYPLSYFPMFSHKRGRVGRVNHLIGLDAEDNEIPLAYTLAGHGGLNQVRRQINRRVREKKAVAVARDVAANVAASNKRAYADVERVQVVTSWHDYDEWFDGNKVPKRRKLRAEVPVPR